MILNGITEFITAPDLLDRSIILPLEHITNRRTESDLTREFASKCPRIFGGILDRLVEGVRNLPNVQLANPARMADFVTWCVACGLKDFENRYQQSQIDNTLALIEDDDLAKGIKGLMERRSEPWEGDMEDLGLALQEFGYKLRENLRSLSVDLRRIAPALRNGLGIVVQFLKRKGYARPVRISKN